MLAYLRIKNLAVIEELVLELGPGLTVFTGETGAGKSIILDGLALALGERASLDQVRSGADRALVRSGFHRAAGAWRSSTCSSLPGWPPRMAAS